MKSNYSEEDTERALQTLTAIDETITQLAEWNKHIESAEDYYSSPSGMQLLAANCTLISAIGEGINRISRILPSFLETSFPEVSWRAIVGMRNHLAHGYFELDADIVYEAVKNDVPPLQETINKAIELLS